MLRTRLVRSPLVIAVLIAASVLVGSNPGRAEDLSDLRRQREQAREAEQNALEQIDLLRADAEVIRDTLLEIQALVDAQVARVEGAQQALAAAEAEVSAREQLARDAEEAIEDTIAQIRVRAVDAYVGTGDSGLEAWLADGDVNQTAIRIAMLDFTAGSERDLLDDLRSHRAELEINVEFGKNKIDIPVPVRPHLMGGPQLLKCRAAPARGGGGPMLESKARMRGAAKNQTK